MKFPIILLISSLLSLSLQAQTNSTSQQQTTGSTNELGQSQLSLFVGPDYNRLLLNKQKATADINFFGGLALRKNIHPQQDLEAFAAFNVKGMYDNISKYRAQYLSLGGHYLYQSHSFFLFTGPQLSLLLNSKAEAKSSIENLIKTDAEYRKKWEEFNELSKYYFSWNLGVGIQLQKNTKLSLIYEIPLYSKLDLFPSFKLKLDISIYDIKSSKKHPSSVTASNSNNNTTPKKTRKIEKKALVVLLPELKKQIKLLEEHQTEIRKKSFIEKRDEDNIKIIKAFEEELSIYPVYFIYNSDLKNLQTGKHKAIFLNQQAQRDPNIQLKSNDFLIGQLAYNIKDSKASEQNKDSDFLNYGFIIKDAQKQDLPKSFPRYTRGYFLMFKNNPKTIARRLNRRLSLYYSGR